MPLVDIQLIKCVFDDEQKAEMIRKVTDAMVSIEGEAMRGVTWVRVLEVAEDPAAALPPALSGVTAGPENLAARAAVQQPELMPDIEAARAAVAGFHGYPHAWFREFYRCHWLTFTSKGVIGGSIL
mgnify:CR=1 FL=1